MGLTPQQLALRENGLGSSDVSAVVYVNPWRTRLGVWATKRTPSRGPLVKPGDTSATEAGTEFEEAVARLYARRTGVKLRRSGTVVSKVEPWMMATPDRLVVRANAGIEIKLVGNRVAHHWHDGVPDYVSVQVRWQAMVLDADWWDVAAMIGTDLRIERVYRDAELEAEIQEVAREFWLTHVVGDTPPPPENEDERKAYLRARYPKPTDEMAESDEEFDAAAIRAIEADRVVKKAEEEAKRYHNDVLELLGNRRGVRGAWGSASAPFVVGKVAWQAVARELSGGEVSADMAERHRAPGGRRLGIYPKRTRT